MAETTLRKFIRRVLREMHGGRHFSPASGELTPVHASPTVVLVDELRSLERRLEQAEDHLADLEAQDKYEDADRAREVVDSLDRRIRSVRAQLSK